MKLYLATTSPYARKVRMVVIEKGLQDRVELVVAIPYENPPALTAANPLGKVPALVTDDGCAIFDNPVICAYLDGLVPEPALIPDTPGRWAVLTREALCDGILDAALGMVLEGRRPAEQRSADWLKRWAKAILRAADAIEKDIAGFAGDLTVAQLGLGAALGYLDFRLPELGWRDGRPKTKAWYDAFSQRQSMIETHPEIS